MNVLVIKHFEKPLWPASLQSMTGSHFHVFEQNKPSISKRKTSGGFLAKYNHYPDLRP